MDFTEETNAKEKSDKWVKEHLKDTYIFDFISKFPNVTRVGYSRISRPAVCRNLIYFGTVCNNSDYYSCDKCWSEEYKNEQFKDSEKET